MKISNEPNFLDLREIRDIKLINRKYRKIRAARNRTIAYAGITFGVAAADAIAQKGIMTIIMGGISLVCMKSVELLTKSMKILKPEYKEILKRTKSIYNK